MLDIITTLLYTSQPVFGCLPEHRQISNNCHWKRRPNSLMMVTVEGEVTEKARRGI